MSDVDNLDPLWASTRSVTQTPEAIIGMRFLPLGPRWLLELQPLCLLLSRRKKEGIKKSMPSSIKDS